MLAVTKLNIKQAPIEREPGPGMTRGYDVMKWRCDVKSKIDSINLVDIGP